MQTAWSRISLQQRRERLAGELILGDESDCPTCDDAPSEVPLLTTRRQNDLRGSACELSCDLEPVRIGKRDVQQHELRAQTLSQLEPRGTVFGLAHDVEALELEQHADRSSKRCMVIDDQHAGHG